MRTLSLILCSLHLLALSTTVAAFQSMLWTNRCLDMGLCGQMQAYYVYYMHIVDGRAPEEGTTVSVKIWMH